jgi:hypothetical protein
MMAHPTAIVNKTTTMRCLPALFKTGFSGLLEIVL